MASMVVFVLEMKFLSQQVKHTTRCPPISIVGDIRRRHFLVALFINCGAVHVCGHADCVVRPPAKRRKELCLGTSLMCG